MLQLLHFPRSIYFLFVYFYYRVFCFVYARKWDVKTKYYCLQVYLLLFPILYKQQTLREDAQCTKFSFHSKNIMVPNQILQDTQDAVLESPVQSLPCPLLNKHYNCQTVSAFH